MLAATHFTTMSKIVLRLSCPMGIDMLCPEKWPSDLNMVLRLKMYGHMVTDMYH
jgi:hypothetical protein